MPPASGPRRSGAPPQNAPGPPSLMAVLVFASLAVMLVYKAYDTFIEPHAATMRARRITNSTAAFESPATLTQKGLPGVGPRRDVPGWMKFQSRLAQEVADGDAGEGFEFVFYGDSITERWRGTEMDNPAPEGPACVKSFDKNFGDLRTALLAISGDQTGHLLWRLQHGELPKAHTPKAAILLIGTNDLGLARQQRIDPTEAAPDAVRRLTATVRLLRKRLPSTHVVIVAILPRGWAGQQDFSWPNKFTKGVDIINEHMAELAAGTANVTFVSCIGRFMLGGNINQKLMPDALHPNAAGLDVLAKCYETALRGIGLLKRRR